MASDSEQVTGLDLEYLKVVKRATEKETRMVLRTVFEKVR